MDFCHGSVKANDVIKSYVADMGLFVSGAVTMCKRTRIYVHVTPIVVQVSIALMGFFTQISTVSSECGPREVVIFVLNKSHMSWDHYGTCSGSLQSIK